MRSAPGQPSLSQHYAPYPPAHAYPQPPQPQDAHGAGYYDYSSYNQPQFVPQQYNLPAQLQNEEMLKKVRDEIMTGGQTVNEKKTDKAKEKKKGFVRQAGGERWFDPTFADWPQNDFRIFVGDLGNEVNDDALAKAFKKYGSFNKAKVSCLHEPAPLLLRCGVCGLLGLYAKQKDKSAIVAQHLK